MRQAGQGHPPDLESLVRLFHDSLDALGSFEEVDAGDVPAPYDRLLAHHGHMTETVESFHGSPVDVRVLATNRVGSRYAREILLVRRRDGAIVQYGIMRVNFDFLSEEVQREILLENCPLGRILIEHNVHRRVQLCRLFRVQCGPRLARGFELAGPAATYGRTARIECDGQGAIELVEIVAPVIQLTEVGSSDPVRPPQ
jgi:chorismate-pyruvate lyase